ncbi:MAG: hypothetical protein J7484_07480 [Microbacterium sp.]|nr:hypothetical protein [Microbacterium sp.]
MRLTWQQASAHAHATAAQIVASLPTEAILSVTHHAGELCRGDHESYAWRALTTVTLTPGTDAEALVTMWERTSRARDDVDVTARRDEAGAWEVRARSTTDASGCIIGEGAPGTIWIDSWSPPFRRPDGLDPAGEIRWREQITASSDPPSASSFSPHSPSR